MLCRSFRAPSAGPGHLVRRSMLWRAAIGLALALVLGGCLTADEQRVVEQINGARSQAGSATLVADEALMRKARGWAVVLASEGALRHSALADGVPPGWRSLAENVGTASSLEAVHGAFLDSPGHRRNMVNSQFTHVGVGVAQDAAGTYWVAQVFLAR